MKYPARTAIIMFRAETTLRDSIEAIAKRNQLSISEAIRVMLTVYIGNDDGRASDMERLLKSLRPRSRSKIIR
jgi:hypothetical protein